MDNKTKNGFLNEIRDFVTPRLSGKRITHTLSLEKETARLCGIYCPDKEIPLRAAAILHDVTKELGEDEQLKLCIKYGILCAEELKKSPKCFHAKTGEALAREVFGDRLGEEYLSAIGYHTTGRENMTLSEKILYLADYIEPERKFRDCVILREHFYGSLEKNPPKDKVKVLDETLLYSFDLTIEDLIREKKIIAPDTFRARNFLCNCVL